MSEEKQGMTRREWLKRAATVVVASTAVGALTSCRNRNAATSVVVDDVKMPDKAPFDAQKIVDELPDATGCIGCDGCMPCGYEVDIPGSLQLYDKALSEGLIPRPGDDITVPSVLSRAEEFVKRAEREIGDLHLPHRCALCGHCMGGCPKRIPIVKEMRQLGDFIDLTRELSSMKR